ncbi:MAG: sterol desaturase family protein [Planctomycetes bacterium]|nr:sterol desaturase family protein [Planctomycetota bacterium]
MVAVIVAVGLVMMGIEALRPARPMPRVRGFWPRAIALNLAQAAVVILAGFTWDRWAQGQSLAGLGRWPAVPAVACGYLASVFVYYWWHRARHEVPLLWRACHQVHHSVSRMGVIAAFYKHPLEFLCNSLLSTLIAYPLLGLTSAQAGWVTALCGIAEFFYHWNVRTPRWLGWIIQRPEMHRIHHRRGHHRHNFADLPLIDLCFGTFFNPRRAEVPCGFAGNREQRLAAMLVFADLHAGPPKETA